MRHVVIGPNGKKEEGKNKERSHAMRNLMGFRARLMIFYV